MEGSSRPLDPLAYPFEIPDLSFIWHHGSVEAADTATPLDLQAAGRIPVLAVGSNASAGQLDLKFADSRFRDPKSPEGRIVILEATAPGIDVVYAAHLAPYGSVPATVVSGPSCTARVFVTWLTPLQFKVMSETERLGVRYRLLEVPGVECHGRVLDSAFAFASLSGAATFDGRPLGLTAVRVDGSALTRTDQVGVWDRIASVLGGNVDGIELAHQASASETVRHRVEAVLQAGAKPDELPTSRIFAVQRTAAAHHKRRSEPYVVAVPRPVALEMGRRRLAMVSNLVGLRKMTCIASVVEDRELAADTIAVDQTIRTAIGLARTGSVLGFVSVTPVGLTGAQWLANKLSWLAGRRYVLLRVAPPDPPDIEKTLCRMCEDDQRSLGVEIGGRVLLISPDRDRAGIRKRSVQALTLTEDMREGRESRMSPAWHSRYPDAARLLAIEGHNDLRPIWLDQDIRDGILKLRVGDVVLVRRSVPNALLGQLLDFGVVLLAAVLALDRVLPHPEWLSTVTAIFLTAAIMIARLRSKLG